MVFVTYGTAAAIPFFDRCFASYSAVYLKDKLLIYCLDEKLYQYCLTKGAEAVLFMNGIVAAGDYKYWSLDTNSIYQKINRQKFKVISEVSKQYSDFIYIDLDTLHLSDVTDYLQSLQPGFYSSVYNNNSFCAGIMYFKNVPAQIFETLLSLDYDDERLLTHFYYKDKMDIKKLDKNIIANPHYGEIPEGCCILHYPGGANIKLKLSLLDNVYANHKHKLV